MKKAALALAAATLFAAFARGRIQLCKPLTFAFSRQELTRLTAETKILRFHPFRYFPRSPSQQNALREILRPNFSALSAQITTNFRQTI